MFVLPVAATTAGKFERSALNPANCMFSMLDVFGVYSVAPLRCLVHTDFELTYGDIDCINGLL